MISIFSLKHEIDKWSELGCMKSVASLAVIDVFFFLGAFGSARHREY